MRSRVIKSVCNLTNPIELIPTSQPIDPGMWTTDSYCFSLNNPQRSLESYSVVNSFWKKAKKYSQDRKNFLLFDIQEQSCTDEKQYLAICANTAAALHVGADIKSAEDKKTVLNKPLLIRAIKYNDPLFIDLLLRYGSNVHQEYDGHPAIFFAQKESIAKLLVAHGALSKPEHVKMLLHTVIKEPYESSLIALYRQHGLNPMTISSYKWTPIMELADEPHNDMINKAVYLLQDLSPQEVIDLLNHTGMNDIGTVFDIIDRVKKHEICQKTIKQLNCYLSILLSRRQIALKTLEREQKSANTQ